MKTFKEYLVEADSLNQGTSKVPGFTVKIKSEIGPEDCTVKLITPESPADKAYWEISMNGKVHGKISQDQVKGLGPNEERVLTIDGKEFWLGGRAPGGKAFEN